MEATEQSSSLFAVFFLSIYTLVLIPYSVYKVCTAASTTSEVVKPWQKVCLQEPTWMLTFPLSPIAMQDASNVCRRRRPVGPPSLFDDCCNPATFCWWLYGPSSSSWCTTYRFVPPYLPSQHRLAPP